MLSLLELFMGSGGGGALSAFRSVRVFRTFRVLRVARILRSLKQMQVIISILSKSASSFAYISVLLMIFIFIFALIGMQIFGNKLNFDGEKPRGNYDNFNIAFLTAFQILTMENWNSLLYDAIRSSQIKFISAMYYIAWIFIGNFIRKFSHQLTSNIFKRQSCLFGVIVQIQGPMLSFFYAHIL